MILLSSANWLSIPPRLSSVNHPFSLSISFYLSVSRSTSLRFSSCAADSVSTFYSMMPFISSSSSLCLMIWALRVSIYVFFWTDSEGGLDCSLRRLVS
jgi:hypothetical protein